MSSAWDGLLNTQAFTEVPHYALGKGLPEDAYFTRRDIAAQCVARLKSVCRQQGIDLSEYAFVEPSAGEGCFYDSLPPGQGRTGLDIAPRRADFTAADYLRWWPQQGKAAKYAVVGNPPFGHRGALALAFVNRSLLFADLVAFILPMSFYSNGKGTNMKRVQGATLLHSEALPRDAFYDPDTKDLVEINTVFQVWRKGKHAAAFCDYDVSDWAGIHTCCSAPKRFCGLGRGREYDCFIASTFYGDDIGIVHDFKDVKYGSGYGIVAQRGKKRAVLAALRNADWLRHSSLATNSCRHIRMFHIREALGEAGLGVRQ